MRNRVEGIVEEIKTENLLPLDRSNWAYFYLESLFTIEGTGKEKSSGNKEGQINLVAGAKTNNGVIRKIKDGKKIFPGNRVTFVKNGDGAAGLAFYQKEQFYATSSVFVLKPSFGKFNQYIGLFVITTMRKFKHEFSHSNSLTLEKYKKLKIKLPQKDGEPDWLNMYNYIKELENGLNIKL